MPPKYDLNKIKFATDEPTFKKAVDLYESGKVAKFKEGIGAYSAVVLGTKPYRVSVEARRFGLANCDCYLGENDTLCKHMVAVAIYAVMGGKKLNKEDKELVSSPMCSGRLGELSKEELAITKKDISSAIKYIKPYNVPSRLWFIYQNLLDEGCARLSAIVSELPVSEQVAKLLVDMLLRLDKKLCTGGVDDSNGTVGGFVYEVVDILKEFIKSKIDKNKSKIIEAEKGYKIITFDMVLPFGLVGFLSKISQALAESNISIFAISAFSTDHILAKEKDLPKAIEKLQKIGFCKI